VQGNRKASRNNNTTHAPWTEQKSFGGRPEGGGTKKALKSLPTSDPLERQEKESTHGFYIKALEQSVPPERQKPQEDLSRLGAV